jgi:hypothetical protein
MLETSRRSFLIGLFGAAAVAAAGPIPKLLEALPQKDFEAAATKAKLSLPKPPNNEIYGNGKDYAFAKIEYLNEEPWFKVTIPDGFRPLREESDRIGYEAMERLYKEIG